MNTFKESLGMSLRQYAAIHLKVPASGKPELDAMIRASRIFDQEIAMRASIYSNSNYTNSSAEVQNLSQTMDFLVAPLNQILDRP